MLNFRLHIALIKGQLILYCHYEKLVCPKIATKLFLDFCPEIFCSFLGASWKLFGLPWDLISNIMNKEAYRKPPGSYKKFQGRIPEIFPMVFWMKLIFHKDILKLTDL